MPDYLKYWKVIRYYAKSKYGLTTADLDMIMFLKSEKYFSKDDFDEFNELLSWDKNRFESLRERDWIEVFRKRSGKKKAIYQLSYKAVRVIGSIYKKLVTSVLLDAVGMLFFIFSSIGGMGFVRL